MSEKKEAYERERAGAEEYYQAQLFHTAAYIEELERERDEYKKLSEVDYHRANLAEARLEELLAVATATRLKEARERLSESNVRLVLNDGSGKVQP